MSASNIQNLPRLNLEIEPGLYLGGRDSIYNLAGNKITAIVSIVDTTPENLDFSSIRQWLPEYLHKFIICLDPSTKEIFDDLVDICNFIKTYHQNGKNNVFIHYMADELLSTTIITAYLMWKHCKPLASILMYIRDYTNIKLPKNLMEQLIRWEGVLRSQLKIIAPFEREVDKRLPARSRCSMCRSSNHNARRCPGYNTKV